MQATTRSPRSAPASENIHKRRGPGGARPNAGRKKGAATLKTREIADRAALEGPTPLEVILQAMREALERDGAEAAVPYARDAAPYMHPRLASVTASGPNGGAIQHKIDLTLSPPEVYQQLITSVGVA